MMKKLFIPAIVSALFVTLAGPGFASGPSVLQRAVFICEINKVCMLQIASDFIFDFTQDGAGETAFDRGYTESADNQTTLTINTNSEWKIEVGRNEWTCPAGTDKAETDLLLRIANSPTGTVQNGYDSYRSPPVQASRESMIEHGEGVSNNQVEIQYKVLLDWTRDRPGPYSITVTYTLTTGAL